MWRRRFAGASAAVFAVLSLSSFGPMGTPEDGRFLAGVLPAGDVRYDCSTQSEIPQSECEALVALFESTNGPEWTTSTGWLATTTPCSWHGVRCLGGSVTDLDLGSNGLNGPMPSELGDLTSLQRMRFERNQLTGGIPRELGNLPSLRQLYLSANRLTGGIPRELGNLGSLRQLFLLFNQLSGAIPEEIGNLSDLNRIHLRGNDFSGVLPLSVAELGGRIQEIQPDQYCTFGGPGNSSLVIPGDEAYRAADSDGDGLLCGAPYSPTGELQCGVDCFDLNLNPADGCECCSTSSYDLPDPHGDDDNCDGVDGEVERAAFVSAADGSDGAMGTRTEPVRTITRGIEVAVARGLRDVYVAAGTYRETVVLNQNVSVYGGYRPDDFGARNAEIFESRLLPTSSTPDTPGTVNAMGLAGGSPGETVFDGFTVHGLIQDIPGAPSYAVYVRDSDHTLRLSHNRIVAGFGGPGERGTEGSRGIDGAAGASGVAALDLWAAYGIGENACTSTHHSPGGQGGATTCSGGTLTAGGDGGESTCPLFDPSATPPGTLPPETSEGGESGANGGGSGGAPGWDVWQQLNNCSGYLVPGGPTDGFPGLEGSPGAHGAGGSGCTAPTGSVVDGFWVGGIATPAEDGSHGGGGGGGGSGGGADVHASCEAFGFNFENLGGTGGGGGAGGCGGTAGNAGGGGGGAFGVFVAFTSQPASAPNLSNNLIEGGRGGPGGPGGPGGVGGVGGSGGAGGAPGDSDNPLGPTFPAFRGGAGGVGGRGGWGGGGGGGCGGPAYGIFVHGQGGTDLSNWKTANTFFSEGSGGMGGFGGPSLRNPGTRGASGASGTTNF